MTQRRLDQDTYQKAAEQAQAMTDVVITGMIKEYFPGVDGFSPGSVDVGAIVQGVLCALLMTCIEAGQTDEEILKELGMLCAHILPQLRPQLAAERRKAMQ